MVDDGGPAFPVTGDTMRGMVGMSLREYYAGQALAGLTATMPSGLFDDIARGARGGKDYVTVAVALADRLIAELKK